MNTKKIVLLFFASVLLKACSYQEQQQSKTETELPSKPYARYWWFASEIEKEDVRYNLNWLKKNGFGGVELAFVYPLNRNDKGDTAYTPRQEWLSEEWQEIVDYSIQFADSIGLACDVTFGTLWPFGDSKVRFEEATQRFGDSNWRQIISSSWEHPKTGYVIDHLTPAHYMPYFKRLMKAIPHPETSFSQSYFIDSWEVETKGLWCNSFQEDFWAEFDYNIVPFMDSLYEPGYEDYLYDYMSLVSDKVLRFYSDFDSVLNANGVLSRGQVSGAPCDLISGYALLDIPEGESMLFEPEFCAIPASAALLSAKNIVSSETFTCLYGWPRDYIRNEQTADLKLVADALFANGINHIVWHGKAHNPAGYDSVNFYASVHVGDSGKLAEETPELNQYLEKVSSYMRKGETYSDIAVYLPTEDAWMAGEMPEEKQFIWAWGKYEMRYVYFPEELKNYNPCWINAEFLEKGEVQDSCFKVGDALFKAIYVDVKYLDYKVLKRLSELAAEGVIVIMKNRTKEPGNNKHHDYQNLLDNTFAYDNVVEEIPENTEPLLIGENVPPNWCRKEGETMYLFFSNPDSKGLKFPLEYGQSYRDSTINIPVQINYNGNLTELKLVFKPYQSLLYKIENGKAERIDIEFLPERPEKISRPPDYKAPWLI